MSNKKNILLTGASGFIGTYFQKEYGEKYNIQTFSFLNDNLDLLDLSNIDTIIHLSALVHQMGGASKEEYHKVNVENTEKLAKKAKSSGVKHFIFMSSIKVYGEETDDVYSETTPCHPQDEYGISKLNAENILKEIEDNNFIVSIVRTPIVYGEGVKANILSLVNIVKRVPILPFYNTSNKRSMVYIGNLSALLDAIIIKKLSGIFLASDDKSLSTSEFIQLIAKVNNTKMVLIPIPFFKFLLKVLKPSHYKRLYKSLEVDNEYTKRILDFKNLYSIEDGIKYI